MRAALNKVKAVVSFAKVVKDPNRLNDVFEFAGEIFRSEHAAGVIDGLKADPVTAAPFEEKKRLAPIDLEVLAALPEGSLGRAFARHLRDNRLDPAALPRYEVSDDATFFRAHLYDTHDIWHVVTGFDTDVAGELGLQAFYAAQIHGKVPLAILAGGMLNTFLYASEDHSARLSAIAEGWMLGQKAKPLFGVDWDALWATPLAEVRARFGLPARS